MAGFRSPYFAGSAQVFSSTKLLPGQFSRCPWAVALFGCEILAASRFRRSEVSRRSSLALLALFALAACGSEEPANPAPTDALAPVIPSASGLCPTAKNGRVAYAPQGVVARTVRLDFDATVAGPRRLILYWHALGGNPDEFAESLEATGQLSDLLSDAWLIAAPDHDPARDTATPPLPWFLSAALSTSTEFDDLIVADELVACLVEQGLVDPNEIHVVGMSAGGLMATQFAYRRSNYVASLVSLSGGLISLLGIPPIENPDNHYPALIFFGGATDRFVVAPFPEVDFGITSEALRADLASAGHPVALCDHGGGHTPPDAAGGMAIPAFFEATPFGTSTPPWEALGTLLPAYCAF